MPIKHFVREILKRSKTKSVVLQTALCYIEAVRAKVPELVRREKDAEGSTGENMKEGDRVARATDEEWAKEAEIAADVEMNESEALVKTIQVSDDLQVSAPISSFSMSLSQIMDDHQPASQSATPTASTASGSLPALPTLPSPLLCPRRTFLASLILASKFTDDRCYSNKAWAKLSGLPAREIGRCERALGDALGWRLWVGKQPVASETKSTNDGPKERAFARSQSESSIDQKWNAKANSPTTLPSATVVHAQFLPAPLSHPPPVCTLPSLASLRLPPLPSGSTPTFAAPQSSTMSTRTVAATSSRTLIANSRRTSGLRRAGTLPDSCAFSTPASITSSLLAPQRSSGCRLPPFGTLIQRPSPNTPATVSPSSDSDLSTPTLTYSPTLSATSTGCMDHTGYPMMDAFGYPKQASAGVPVLGSTAPFHSMLEPQGLSAIGIPCRLQDAPMVFDHEYTMSMAYEGAVY